MARVRFAELQSRPMEFMDFTSVTLDEFQQLVPPFEAVFHARMAVGGWMESRGPLVGFPCTKTAPCRRRKSGYSSCSPTKSASGAGRGGSPRLLACALLPLTRLSRVASLTL